MAIPRLKGTFVPRFLCLLTSQCLAAAVAVADPSVFGENMEVVPGFPHDQTFVPGQLLYRQVGLGRITNIIYHNGWLYTNNFGDERRHWRFTDPSDPASLTLMGTGGRMYTDHGTHGHKKVGRWAGGVFMPIYAESPGVTVVRPSQSEMPENYVHMQTPGNSHFIYYPWKVPFNWVQYGGSSGRGPISRGNQLLTDFDSLASHGVAGTAILLGDVLFMASDGSDQGVLSYDLTPIFDGGQPILLDKLSGNIGGYLAGIWEHYLILSGGDSVSRNLTHVVDISDPTNLKLVTTINLRGTPALDAGTSVPYVQTQDEFVFTRRHKINMETLIAAQDPESGFTEADALVLELDEVGNNRPAGSVSGPLDVSQFTLPIGNLLVSASYSFGGRDGIGVWAHQAEPDTRPPYVGYHRPLDGQTNFPLGAPISLVIAETLESFTVASGDTVIVRPVGGEPLVCWTSVAYDSIVTITPRTYFEPDTTYEVILDGIKDAAGNALERYAFTFSTGSDLQSRNTPPEVHGTSSTPVAPAPGERVLLTVDASDPDGDALEYRVDFGDGSGQTEWRSEASFSHTYAEEGHYAVSIHVRDIPQAGDRQTTLHLLTQTVAEAPPSGLPTHSSTIALDADARKVWLVNRDNDSVSRMDADTMALDFERDLGQLLDLPGTITPSSLAVVPGTGDVWITCERSDQILVLSRAGTLIRTISVPYGHAPQRVSLAPDGSRAYVSLYAGGQSDRRNGQLLRFNTLTGQETGRVELGPTARPIAVSADGAKVYVGRFLSKEHYGELWAVDAESMTLSNTIELWRDRGRLEGMELTGDDGPGVPNLVSSLQISPHGDILWYTALKMDDTRGLFFQQGTDFNSALSHEATSRSIMGRVFLHHPEGPLEPGRHEWGNDRTRIDVDNSDFPFATAFSPLGDYVFVALQGNNQVRVFDDLLIRNANGGRNSVWNLPAGSAPQGLLLDPATQTLWIQNFMSRDVTIHNLEAFFRTGTLASDPLTVVSSSFEKLSPDVLEGKVLFYFAGDHPQGINHMGREGYISCATCHLDAGHDGRTWDFTQRGEGLRNTTDLRGRAGLEHGRVHWTANFDEIQDFIIDIINEFGGTGFLPEGETPHPPLDSPNAGRSPELDNLASYVTSLDANSLLRSPYRNSNGALTESAIKGARIFEQLNCMTCHDPRRHYTDSTQHFSTLHDVGTLRTSSGHRLGGPLDGIDTPTLLGIWDTPPYFHDGSARALQDVFEVAGGKIYEAEEGTGGTIPEHPDSLGGSGFHGNFVLGNVTFSPVDGGKGGTGAAEVRFLADGPGTLRLTLNEGPSQTFDYDAQKTHFEWRRARFENLPLKAGASNSILVERISGIGTFALDNLTISTPDILDQALVHRTALQLDPTEFQALLDYLLQLDGRDLDGGFPENTPLLAWRTQHFSEAELADPTLEATLWGDEADPDRDGLPNLLEYALNGNPRSADSADLLRSFRDGTDLVFQFTKHREELIYRVEASPTLAPESWTSDGLKPTPAAIDAAATGTEIEVRLPIPSNSNRFLRLQVYRSEH